jgi:hypothetical protein
MKDSKDNKISFGDRVKVLWNFNDQHHIGKVVDITDNIIIISAPSHRHRIA